MTGLPLGEEYPALEDTPEDSWDRATLREALNPALVLSFARHVGRDETVRVYGVEAAVVIDTADESARAGFGRPAGRSWPGSAH
ncbi:hypothetical protein ACWDG1_49040 [Streptomyces sp. NPDC001177]